MSCGLSNCTSGTRCLRCTGLAMAVLWRLQVWRWSQQYESQLVGSPLPEMQRLSAWLKDHVPPDDEDSAVSRISHGDFRCVCRWTRSVSWVGLLAGTKQLPVMHMFAVKHLCSMITARACATAGDVQSR